MTEQEKTGITITIHDRTLLILVADPYFFIVEENDRKLLIPEGSLDCFEACEALWEHKISEVIFDITLMREYEEANRQYSEKIHA